jgi:hypothetical protein
MADALASGASVRKDVGVQVPPRAPWVSTKKARGHPLQSSHPEISISEFLARVAQWQMRRFALITVALHFGLPPQVDFSLCEKWSDQHRSHYRLNKLQTDT